MSETVEQHRIDNVIKNITNDRNLVLHVILINYCTNKTEFLQCNVPFITYNKF